ncbi:MAG: hypothetical protein H6742_05770 [Alphaproteobacteria bacterium]|nr:hypothetical protein [Alphaproteobacteria bacterium]
MPRQQISINAVFVGVAALIPVPILDDIVRRAMMRGLYQAIGAQRGVPLDDASLDLLTKSKGFSVLGCLLGPVWYLVKKISKKILFFLAVKDALDWAAEAAIRGELVLVAIDQGALPGDAQRVRDAMDLAWKKAGGSPVTRAVTFRDSPEMDWKADEGGAVPLVHHLARRGAGAQVVARFREELARPAPSEPEPETSSARTEDRAEGEGSGAEKRT